MIRILTHVLSDAAVHIEGIVAQLRVGVAGLEQETVGTELGLGDVAHTLVVLVTLFGVREEAVLLRTSEVN